MITGCSVINDPPHPQPLSPASGERGAFTMLYAVIERVGLKFVQYSFECIQEFQAMGIIHLSYFFRQGFYLYGRQAPALMITNSLIFGLDPSLAS
jgi:hypothetical protein